MSTIAEPQYITPKQAAIAAVAYLKELSQADGIFVEEAELDKKRGVWSMTLSHDAPGKAANLFGELRDMRQFKTLTVDARSGEVVGMRIRKL